MNILRLNNYPILDQLQLEEALLRTDNQNWCIVNSGSAPSIILGISSNPKELVHPSPTLPLIRRFSGGGTVVVDENTLFVTFICNISDFDVQPFPQPILCWSGKWYRPLLKDFQIQENDFVFNGKKFGGNAQYITKKRWLHHSTLLWDFCPERMNQLTLPNKRPNYRQDRSHTEFLTTLHSHFPNREEFLDQFLSSLSSKHKLTSIPLSEVLPILSRPHRKTTSTHTFD